LKTICSAGRAATRQLARLGGEPAAYKNFLYLTVGCAVIFAPLPSGPKLAAQDQLPQIVVREAPKAKKDNGPRALGLLRLSNGKATLIPVAILINGKFYDASAYKADPVPMALDTGTVYEAERSGDSLGLFTVNGVLHSRDVNSQNPWVAKGSYLPNGSVAQTVGRKAETVPVGLQNDEGPPRLTRGDEPKPASSGSAPSAPAGSGSDKPASTTSTPSSSPSSTTGGASGGDATKANPPATPAKPADQSASQTSSQKAQDQAPSKDSSSSSDDSYRPVLRRGKPTRPLPDDDYTEPAVASKPSADAPFSGKTSPGAAPDNAAELIPAISDAAGPEPRSYKFDWRKGEEGDRQQQMLDLAKTEFQAYLQQQEKATITEKSPVKKAAGTSRKAVKTPQPELENVQFRAFDVWSNNEPVMILSAEAHMPTGWKAEGAAAPDTYSILLVARTDIYSNLHKLYVGITDKYHLDLTPRLELIDVVDADGDGRGEFLFRETSDAGTGYVICRATADTLWKMYNSLSPE
jgi:hypothetical protein